jgi:hypothetical protein
LIAIQAPKKNKNKNYCIYFSVAYHKSGHRNNKHIFSAIQLPSSHMANECFPVSDDKGNRARF